MSKRTKLNIMKRARKVEEQSELNRLLDISPELRANKFNDRHYDVAPNAFRVGDIVEAQISFEVIWLKGKRQKMIVILRALTLLDKEALEVSNGNCQKIISLNNPTECDQSTDQSSSQ